MKDEYGGVRVSNLRMGRHGMSIRGVQRHLHGALIMGDCFGVKIYCRRATEGRETAVVGRLLDKVDK